VRASTAWRRRKTSFSAAWRFGLSFDELSPARELSAVSVDLILAEFMMRQLPQTLDQVDGIRSEIWAGKIRQKRSGSDQVLHGRADELTLSERMPRRMNRSDKTRHIYRVELSGDPDGPSAPLVSRSVIELARHYGRYRYRRIAALLRLTRPSVTDQPASRRPSVFSILMAPRHLALRRAERCCPGAAQARRSETWQLLPDKLDADAPTHGA
jgi:hypothetical protein